MTKLLRSRGIRIFEYPAFAAELRDRVRAAAATAAAGVTIEHIAKSHVRKEAVVAKILASRGDHPGLVHVISAMEACDAYQPWHDKRTHRTFLRPDSGKCLHYYFYFIDAELGLIYLRVPTWCPFRLQFYCNSHNWLARRLAAAGIGFTMADNVFAKPDDWPRAQALADTLSPDALHHVMDRYAAQCCPVLDVFPHPHHWSLMQVEYSTDLVFRSQTTLKPLYEQLARQAVLSVKAEHVATHGKLVLGHDGLGGLGAAGVFRHPEVVEEQPWVPVELADFLGDVGDASGLDQADGETAQTGDVFRAVAGADPAAIFVVDPVEDVMAGIFDGPVTAVDLEDAFGVGLLG